MAYTKPEVMAQNSAQGSFAASCPALDAMCRACDRTE